MSLSTDTLLFGIALIVFGNWIEVSGLGGWPFAVTGLGLTAIALFASIVSTTIADPPTDDASTQNDQS